MVELVDGLLESLDEYVKACIMSHKMDWPGSSLWRGEADAQKERLRLGIAALLDAVLTRGGK